MEKSFFLLFGYVLDLDLQALASSPHHTIDSNSRTVVCVCSIRLHILVLDKTANFDSHRQMTIVPRLADKWWLAPAGRHHNLKRYVYLVGTNGNECGMLDLFD